MADKTFPRVPSHTDRRPSPLRTAQPQLFFDARNALTTARYDPYTSLSRINSLCEIEPSNALLLGIRGEVLECCYKHEIYYFKKKQHLDAAITSVRTAFELSEKKNLFFSTYLGYLLGEASTDVQGMKMAIHQLLEGYYISDPIDPLHSHLLLDDERNQFSWCLSDRINSAREQILITLGFCFKKLYQFDSNNSSATIQELLRQSKLDLKTKARLLWFSLPLHDKQHFINVDDLKSFLIASSHKFAAEVVTLATSSYKSKSWNYWSCTLCNKTFNDPSMYLIHLKTHHLDPSGFYDLVEAPHWVLTITYMGWIPLLLDDDGVVRPRDCKECHSLLEAIREKLSDMISAKCFLEAHMHVLFQHSLKMIPYPLRQSVINLGLDKNGDCMCLLESTHLQAILDFVGNMHDFAASIFENRDLVEEPVNNKISRHISISDDSMFVLLDEQSFSPSENSAGTDHVKSMLSWVFSAQPSDESLDVILDKWIDLFVERKFLGEQLIEQYKVSLQNFQTSLSLIHIDSRNNDSQLSNIEKETLEYAMDVHQLELKIIHCDAYDYEPIVLSILKPYLQFCIQKSVEGAAIETTMTSDGAKGIAEGTPEPKPP